ncbi:MAG: VOC family protein [Burkholderiaceae bacterium]
MLERVDRMQLAVADTARAENTMEIMLGAQLARRDSSQFLNARRSVMTIGDSQLELCEPAGPGLTRTHLDNWGEGLMAAGFSVANLDQLCTRLDTKSAAYHRENQQVFIAPELTAGLPMVISKTTQRATVGPISYLYEATNTLDTDWRRAADRYVDLFGLNPAQFSPIENSRFGYQGSLTLFNPPNRLDRIELSQTFPDQPGAMRRFVERRGNSLYMCFVEAHDFPGLKNRLINAGASLTPRSGELSTEQDTVWVHPKNLHGMLLGISRPGFAWTWSGRPELVPAVP